MGAGPKFKRLKDEALGVRAPVVTKRHVRARSARSSVGSRSELHDKMHDGLAITEALRDASPLFRWLERLLNVFVPYAGRPLLEVHVPTAVAAVRPHIAVVEGAAFVDAWEGEVEKAFSALADAANADSYNLAGRVFVQKLFDRSATTRLRVYEHIARNPSIKEIELAPPVFVIGLPRTGSSHLQALLASDADAATLKLWEMMQPLPLCEHSSLRATARQQYLSFEKTLVDILAPGWNEATSRFHDVSMSAPEEEAVLLAGCGVSLMPFVCIGGAASPYEALHNDSTNKRAALRYLRRFLQMLDSTRAPKGGGPGRPTRWVLKSHYNALWIDALLAEFPGAKVIVTVREPHDVIQSFVSYSLSTLSFVAGKERGVDVRARAAPRRTAPCRLATSRSCPSPSPRPPACTRRQLARKNAAASYAYLHANASALVQLHRRLASASSGNYHIVRYDELVANPEEVMKQIYSQLEMPLTPRAVEGARAYLAGSRQHRLGKPAKVAISELGLSAERIQADFREYCEELLHRPPTVPAAEADVHAAVADEQRV